MMYEYLLQNGMTKEEYHWFEQNQVSRTLHYGQ